MKNIKTALICGVTGQDGAYLANFLLSKGYIVIGTSRDADINSFSSLKRLNIEKSVICVSMALNDFRSVLQIVSKYEPDEIYNLAGQSSVGLSFDQPVETMESITLGVLNLLEVVRYVNKKTKIYNAGSSECFGDIGLVPATENTPFSPRSPYAVAKVSAYWQISNYREAYGLFACTGLLFNHESPLRPDRFVTQKIINGARKIKNGTTKEITLGNLEIARDWGWAPDYVESMWLMLQREMPEDFIVATGETHYLKEFVSKTFAALDLDWMKFVKVDNNLQRPLDIRISRANPDKAKFLLPWQSNCSFDELILKMVNHDLF